MLTNNLSIEPRPAKKGELAKIVANSPTTTMTKRFENCLGLTA